MPPVKDDDAQRETICTRNSMFVPFCLMQYVLDKDLNPCEAFLLLYDIIKTAKLTGCKGLPDFYRVGGTLATGATVPSLARATAGNITAMSVSRPLIRFIKTKVLQRDLKGLIPDTTKIDPVARQMSNAVVALILLFPPCLIRCVGSNVGVREGNDSIGHLSCDRINLGRIRDQSFQITL